MSATFVLPKKKVAALMAVVELKTENRKKLQEKVRLQKEAAAASEAAEREAAEKYQAECKTINAIRRKNGPTIGLTFKCKIHVPTFNAALEQLGLDSCECLAYANPTQRQKAVKIWANQLPDALHMAYPKANMKRKHPMFLGIVQ